MQIEHAGKYCSFSLGPIKIVYYFQMIREIFSLHFIPPFQRGISMVFLGWENVLVETYSGLDDLNSEDTESSCVWGVTAWVLKLLSSSGCLQAWVVHEAIYIFSLNRS